MLKSSEDIAANVLVAMRADSDRKSELIDPIVNRLFRRPFRRFAGIRTSSTFEKFGSGVAHYIYAHLVATASGRVETTQIAYEDGRLADIPSGAMVKEPKTGFDEVDAVGAWRWLRHRWFGSSRLVRRWC